MTNLTEADVEAAALEWLASIGWQVTHGPDIAPDTPGAERDDYRKSNPRGRQEMPNLCPTLNSLLELGFEHREPVVISDTVGFRFGPLDLTASHMMNMYARYVVVLGGTIDTGRTFSVVDHQIPDDLEDSLEAAAWISYVLRSNRSDLGPLPEWFLEGERRWDLVYARMDPEGWERRRAYEATPKCIIDREYARPLRRYLAQEISRLQDGECLEMTVTFDGRVLSIESYGHPQEVVASGDSWPSQFKVVVSSDSELPARFTSWMVEVSVFEGFIRFDRVRLGPCEALE